MLQFSVGVRVGFLRVNVFPEEYMILHCISFQALSVSFHTTYKHSGSVLFFHFNETLFFDDGKNLTDGSVITFCGL